MTQGEMIYLAVVLCTFLGFAAVVGSVSRIYTREYLRAEHAAKPSQPASGHTQRA
jgi:hypothetical protein